MLPEGSKFFPLSEVIVLKKEAIEEITAHFNCLPLMYVNSLMFWFRPCITCFGWGFFFITSSSLEACIVCMHKGDVRYKVTLFHKS